MPFSIEGTANVKLHTVKRGEDDVDGKAKTAVLRLYEHWGGHGEVKLSTYVNKKVERTGADQYPSRGLKVRSASIVNVLEDEMEPLEISKLADGDANVDLRFNPFEIKTVKLVLA